MRDVLPQEEDPRRSTLYPIQDVDVEKSTIQTTPSLLNDHLSIISSSGTEIYDEPYDPNYDTKSEALDEDSPYPEVRSAVANFDDPSMPASTIRAWVLGVIWAMVIPGMNQFFYLRYPSVTVTGLVAQLLIFPFGRFWAYACPNVSIFSMPLNPGPFTIKEHVLVTIMATVGAETAYATDIVAVQRVYYNQVWPFEYQWMLVMSTQLIGFSIGGVARRFLVAPPSMIWPNTLVSCALFNTLHSQSYAGVGQYGSVSRERFFAYALGGTFVWYFFPGYLFEALSVFTWVCWIAPNNVKINQLFGYHSGLGFSIFTFDWSQIAYIGSPLATPWWAQANVIIGFLFFFWFLTPVLYYTNAFYAQYMPVSSRSAYDNTGAEYNLTRILTADATIDIDAYRAYSPLYLSITFVMCYGLSFLAISATVTHAIIHFYKPIMINLKRSLREQPDIHARLMSRYQQVPEWHYVAIFVVTFAFACACIEVWPSGMTIWALLVALVISLLYLVPIGMIQAVTNRQVGLNVITELIVGFMLPGKPVAMMMFKTYGYITMAQAMQFTADFKLGHYMKVPPRPMFWCQIVATMIAGTVQLAVQAWMFTNIPALCTPNQRDNFTCPSTQVFGTASIIWGVIGPKLQFSAGQVYYTLTFFFIIGAACPVILWLITKKYPTTILNYLNFPLVFSGTADIPPATAVNYVGWATVGFAFQYFIRRRWFGFWTKYNYVLSAALDAGTALGIIAVYFCLQYPMNGTIGAQTLQRWWGNTVYKDTLDWRSTPLRQLDDGTTFGCVGTCSGTH
ncbi:OPT oligopeptide transporter protein-domain-containing protein [Schizophyllum amplum]|uniref:OPT oligopeptide transporter protein-domain-containing protein n=1 Tax=Schizophyllum amplum TaxID=97359 RepID=A0A550BXW6_9AGAR|nr:OPT oligopeptide transporter protein-domain-containing protein [Auriculariopsis ampla]